MVDTLVSLVQLYQTVPYLYMLPRWHNMLAICTMFTLLTVNASLSTLNTSAHTPWSDYKDHRVLLLQTSIVHAQQPRGVL